MIPSAAGGGCQYGRVVHDRIEERGIEPLRSDPRWRINSRLMNLRDWTRSAAFHWFIHFALPRTEHFKHGMKLSDWSGVRVKDVSDRAHSPREILRMSDAEALQPR